MAAVLLAAVFVASLVGVFLVLPTADGAQAAARRGVPLATARPADSATPPEPAAWPPGSPALSDAVAAPTFADASRLFRAGRYAAAYGRFVTMANEGDMHAARVALVMHRFGPTLFGSDWDATTEELAEWSRLARSAEQADIDARLHGGRSR